MRRVSFWLSNAGSRTSIEVAAVCLLALGLRLVGLQYGLPAVYNPDEVSITARALSFARGSLNPHNFLYPTFYFYVLFAWIGVYLAFVWLTGRVSSLQALQQLYFTDPSGIYTAGRTLGVAAGTATVAAIYGLASGVTDRRTALASALFLAVSPVPVLDSHYVKHDVPAALMVVLAYLAMTRVWPTAEGTAPRPRDTVVAGAACGAALSTHYYCVFLAIPLVLTIVQGWKRAGPSTTMRQLLYAGAAFVLVFAALSPFLLVEPMTAVRDVIANRQIVIDRAVNSGAFAPGARYLEMLWLDTVTWPIALLAVLGVLGMLASEPSRAIFLLAFPIPFLIFISNTTPASRYLNAVAPFMTLFAAWAVARIMNSIAARRPALFWVVVAIAAVPGFLASTASDRFIRRDDTRALAQRFIEANIPAGATILIQPYSAVLTPSRDGLIEALRLNLGSVEAASTKFQLQLSLNPYPGPAYRLIYLGRGGLDAEKIYVDPADLAGEDGIGALRRLDVEYVVVKRYNRVDPDTLSFMTALSREGQRIAVFSPYRRDVSDAERARIEPFLHNTDARIVDALERPGPPLEIWQLHAPGT